MKKLKNKVIPIILTIAVAIVGFLGFKPKTVNAATTDIIQNTSYYSFFSGGSFTSYHNFTYTASNNTVYSFDNSIEGSFNPVNFSSPQITSGNGYISDYGDFRVLYSQNILTGNTGEPDYQDISENVLFADQRSIYPSGSNRFLTEFNCYNTNHIRLELKNLLIPQLDGYTESSNIKVVLNRILLTYSFLNYDTSSAYITYYDNYTYTKNTVTGWFNDHASYGEALNNSIDFNYEDFDLKNGVQYLSNGQVFYLLDSLVLDLHFRTTLNFSMACWQYELLDSHLWLSTSDLNDIVTRFNSNLSEDIEQDGYDRGYNIGHQDGYVEGEVDGYNLALEEFENPFSLIVGAVEAFLNFELFPDFHFYYILLIALGFSLFGLLVKYALGG